MAGKENKLHYLRKLNSGVPLYLRLQNEGGTWRRPGIFDEPYFSDKVGGRVDDEFDKHKEQVLDKYGHAIGMAIIE